MRYLIMWIAVLASAAALAGEPSDGQSGRQWSAGKLAQALQLDEQRAEQVAQILNGERERLRALRDEGADGDGDVRSEMQRIHEDTLNQLRGILDEQQMEKLQQVLQRRREQMRDGQDDAQQ
jgi:hypothetical protein